MRFLVLILLMALVSCTPPAGTDTGVITPPDSTRNASGSAPSSGVGP